MLLVKANFSLFSYSVFLVLEINLWKLKLKNWSFLQYPTPFVIQVVLDQLITDVIFIVQTALIYCRLIEIVSQLDQICAPNTAFGVFGRRYSLSSHDCISPIFPVPSYSFNSVYSIVSFNCMIVPPTKPWFHWFYGL